ncbi:unnamed protein product [Heterobilharzia americana]|nr:unnamed protein product [Heterobilharzia americana]
MPKNKGKGGKNRRRGKNENESQKRDLIYKEAGQEIIATCDIRNNHNMLLTCNNHDDLAILVDMDKVPSITRQFKITTSLDNHILLDSRPSIVCEVWISNGDIILIGLRDYQDNKADVIMKYLNDEARTLKSLGEIPDTIKLEENDDIEFDANAAIFDDEDEDGEKGSDSEEDGSDDDENSDDSDEIAEVNQRFRADSGVTKDQRNNRRR